MRGMLFGLFWLFGWLVGCIGRWTLDVGRCGRQEADKECERTIQKERIGLLWLGFVGGAG
jgi:hypothetical protein